MIVTATALGHDLQKAGVIAAAILAALATLAPAPRLRGLTALTALLLTPVLLIASIWGSAQLQPLRRHPLLAAAAIALGLCLMVGGAALLRRRPALFALAVAATLPFRIPVASGGTTANLLVPLYFVIGAGTLAAAIDALRGAPAGLGREAARHWRALELALMAFIVLYAVQSVYSSDAQKALQQVVFFYVPFALMFAVLIRLEWPSRLPQRCMVVLVALALIFVAIGFYEYATRTVLLSPKVLALNQTESYFRVNSVFFDPNIYGRFLALVMIAVCTGLLWSAERRATRLAAAVLALLWAGLLLTLSESSFAALLAGLVVLAALRWSVRATALVTALLAVAATVVVLALPNVTHIHLHSSASANASTSGRLALVKGGLALFAQRPLQGYGSGSFSVEYRNHHHGGGALATTTSHTIPVTVAAEQGIIGLIPYLMLLGALLLRLRGAAPSPLRAALAAALVGLVVHTLFYAAFLEDPFSWALIALTATLPGLPTTPGAALRIRRRLQPV